MANQFDPNAAASEGSGIFGLPFTEQDSALVYLPVPWEATTSYGGGTSLGPAAIFEASKQVDLFDLDVEKPYKPGLFMMQESPEVKLWNTQAKASAQKIIEAAGVVDGRPELQKDLLRVNQHGDLLNQYVYRESRRLLDAGKILAVVGGDHSVPFGAFQAIGEKFPGYGILHFDAHSDTRNAYEGFTWSHASIMFNALKRIPQIGKLVQVGIRDFCEQEVEFCESQGSRVSIFYDGHLSKMKFEGSTWAQITQKIISELPDQVWISFDIDGLDPSFCPHTGTPVPGGLHFQEANFILGALVRANKTIIGFDLNEVAPDPEEKSEWDANVGARLLYKMSAWTLASQKLAKLRK